MGNNLSINNGIKFNIINEKAQAESLLSMAEKKDMYIEECHDDKANSISRKDLTYRPNIMSKQDTEQAHIYLNSVIHKIPDRLRMDLGVVNIIQLMPTADGGMPHTRPDNIICYPNISQLFSESTLIHELCNIHQRLYQIDWL